jgi:hypothetical protein
MDQAEVYHINFSKLNISHYFGSLGIVVVTGRYGGFLAISLKLFDLNCKVCDNQTIM